jgi:cellulose synthase/poly-beta-1,6-N-acetylglucosamine synthase-like glycosyltransferase
MTLAFFFRQEVLENAFFSDFVMCLYFISLLILFSFGAHGFVMVYYYLKQQREEAVDAPLLSDEPVVTVQLPVYNELYVVKRIIEAVCAMDYPKEKLEIQVLDDSTDETVSVVAEAVALHASLGFDIKHIRRSNRSGFKAGALKNGLTQALGEFIAIFDADFVPRVDFLKNTLPYFENEQVGLVQTRWEHLNDDYSFLTRTQALALDGHFVMEQDVRNKAGYFINFNGTGGIWRKACILDAGNWQSDTLTEDLDLSYRAQLKGWKFKYLNDFTSPAELPAEVSALKSQQFRWTKGAIETARKLLPAVWKSGIPFRIKVHSTFHLTNNIVFPFIVLAGILNVPLMFIKQRGGHEAYFQMMSVFVLAFVGSFLFYLFSQKAVYPDWRRRILLFPLFMAASMGFAVNNSRAVFEALFRKKSDFIRTPKYAIQGKHDSWREKKYAGRKVDWVVAVEIILALYCFFGVISSLYYMEIAAVPFQLLFFFGFSSVAALSVKHALDAHRQQ